MTDARTAQGERAAEEQGSSARYVSTRGGMDPRPFTDILLEGLAPDGGLIVTVSDFLRFAAVLA